MNWVAPIKDEETLRKYEEELLSLDVKYFIMFRIGVGTGMQVQDILKLTVGDVRDKDSIVVYLGTHKVKRSYRFEPDLKKVIQEYTEGKADDAPLFRGMKQNPVSREQAYRALKNAGTRIGLGTIGAQTMRKTFAWKYYKNTGDIYYLTNLLNHASRSRSVLSAKSREWTRSHPECLRRRIRAPAENCFRTHRASAVWKRSGI